MGSLSPHLVTPLPPPPKKPHHHFGWADAAKIIAVAIVIAVAPELAGMALAAAGITAGVVTSAVATGVVAAIGDAAVQGVAIGLGAQEKFSTTEMLETAVTAGVGTTLPGVDSWAAAGQTALTIGSAAVATQLVEMAAGIRDKLDARAVALQVAEALIGSQISKGIHAELGESTQTMVADNVANSAVSSLLGHGVTGAPIEIQSIAANAVGSTAAGQIKNDLYLKQQSEKSKTSTPQKVSSSQKTLAPQASSSHDIAEAEMVANYQLPDAKLPLNNKKYGEASYELSEMNSRRNQLPQGYNKIHDSTWGNDEYYAAGRAAGLAGKPMPNVNRLTSQQQARYAEGYASSVDVKLASAIIDGISAVSGMAAIGKAAMGLASKVGLFGVRGTESIEAMSSGAAFNGTLYPKEKLQQLVKYLERRNVSVFGTEGNPAFIARADGSGQMLLPENPTVLQVKHELSHYLDFKKSGFEAYRDMGRTAREASVLNRLQQNRVWNQLNNTEREFSVDYVDRLLNQSKGLTQ